MLHSSSASWHVRRDISYHGMTLDIFHLSFIFYKNCDNGYAQMIFLRFKCFILYLNERILHWKTETYTDKNIGAD